MVFSQRRYPAPRSEVVESPEIMGGRPCIAGTRIPAATIVVQIRAGFSDEEIFRHYPGLPVDGIDVVRAWAADRDIDLSVDAPAQ